MFVDDSFIIVCYQCLIIAMHYHTIQKLDGRKFWQINKISKTVICSTQSVHSTVLELIAMGKLMDIKIKYFVIVSLPSTASSTMMMKWSHLLLRRFLLLQSIITYSLNSLYIEQSYKIKSSVHTNKANISL